MQVENRKPSSKDVALKAGVSQATVSNVFSGRQQGFVSREKRALVLEAAEKLGYRPNRLARGLLTGKTNTVGIFVSFLGSRFHADIVFGAQEILGENDYSVLIAASETTHTVDSSKIDFLMGHRVDALLIIGGTYYDRSIPSWCRDVMKHGIACAIVDDRRCCESLDCIVSDDNDGMRKLLAYYAAKGHKRIGYIGAGWTSTTALDREQGYLEGVQFFGLDSDPELIIGHASAPGDIAAATRFLLSLPNPPTVIVAANDPMATFVCRTVSEMAAITGRCAQVAGYGNQENAELLQFTSVSQNPRRMGRAGGQALIDRLKDPNAPPRMIVTPVDLVSRDSEIGAC